MHRTVLTFVVITAAASLVSAAPVREETTERIGYNERVRPPQTAVAGDPGWIELVSATPANRGREFILIGARTGTFTRLRLTAASGRPGVQAVRVYYQDGGQRVFRVDRMLEAHRQPIYLDLRGAHELTQIVVTSDRQSRGSYVLEGGTLDGIASR